MRFTNVTPFEAAWTTGYERDGRELLIVIVKATYRMPMAQEPAELDPVQSPLVQADEFVGEPGVSAPRRETDFAHRKPGCDVLLLGQAYAPTGTAATRIDVGLRVGTLVKQFSVVGDRHWSKGAFGLRASDPLPFVSVPIGYERAFGGTDRTEETRSGKVETFLANPFGRGYWRHTEHIDGQPLPNTEELDRKVSSHYGGYRPMALGPVGRNWMPRCKYAGTYDAHWLEERAPFWPDDFDARYFQAAPADQVIPFPAGGEEVVLQGLSPAGARAFRLPVQPMPVTFVPYKGADVTRQAVIDTVVLEPDEDRFTLTWRCNLAPDRSVFDVKETIAGEMSEAWHRARRFPGKAYYRGLGQAVAARRGRMRT